METTANKDGAKFISIPFEFDGRQFRSRVLVGSNIYNSVMAVPQELFIQMNQECLAELLGIGLDLDKVKQRLYELNEGASSAYIELVNS